MISADLKIVLYIITGRGKEVLNEAENWDHAQDLYAAMDCYKLHNYRPWFSAICRTRAWQDPWDAIFIACNESPFDEDLLMHAMTKGFEKQPFSTICNPIYYEEIMTSNTGRECWKTLVASNIKPLLGLRLGVRGLMAYHTTFMAIWIKDTEKISWHDFAVTFVQRMREIEAAHKSVSNVHPNQR
jgi:hypothetical protein